MSADARNLEREIAKTKAEIEKLDREIARVERIMRWASAALAISLTVLVLALVFGW